MNHLSLEKKARLFQGKDHWHINSYQELGIPEITMADGPNGLRVETEDGLGFNPSKPSTALPTESLLACSFDRSLLRQYGNVLAEECISAGVDIILGPGVCHKRSPLCGRNFEYFSEDPVLSGELAAAYIQGVQEKGVGTSLKHFACNSREKGRMIQDSIVDQRTLHEIYLKAFQIAVEKSHPWTIMPAYNLLNGIHCSEHKELMDEGRRWGFDGAYISDWGGTYDPVESLRNGLNLEMPGGDIHADQMIIEAIENHVISEEQLDQSTEAILKLIKRCSTDKKDIGNRNAHIRFAQKCAEESAVLLENKDHVLPLQKEQTVALIGHYARRPRVTGNGSSCVNAHASDSLYTAFTDRHILFEYEEGYSETGMGIDDVRIQRAVNLAAKKDIAVICCALPEGLESEGYDRIDMSLPEDQLVLIQDVAKVNPNTIVILQCGSPVNVPFKDKIKGLLLMYLGGCQSGKACASLLYGDSNPSGKLAETWPVSLEDTPSYRYFDDDMHQVQYREGIYTGYRYYDTFRISVAYPFGYGLSYTEFSYHDFNVQQTKNSLLISVNVKNIGTCKGKEVIQLYAGMKDSQIARADHELIDFQKIELDVNEEKSVWFTIDLKTLQYFDTQQHNYSLEQGKYTISIGTSIQHLFDEKQIELIGNEHPYSSLSKEYLDKDSDSLYVSNDSFEKMLGYPIPKKKEDFPFTRDTTITELKAKKLGSFVNVMIERIVGMMHIKVTDFKLAEVPIRQLLWLEGMNWDVVDLGVEYMNKHSASTLKSLIHAYRKASKKK